MWGIVVLRQRSGDGDRVRDVSRTKSTGPCGEWVTVRKPCNGGRGGITPKRSTLSPAAESRPSQRYAPSPDEITPPTQSGAAGRQRTKKTNSSITRKANKQNEMTL